MLLIGQFPEVPDFPEVGIIFEADEQIRVKFARKACGRREVRLAIFSESNVDDRVDDEFVVRIADADDRPYFKPESGLRELRS
jgi:hypothetical protein